MIKSPCKNCKERKAACHDTCNKYKELVIKIKKENEERKKYLSSYYDERYKERTH